MASIVLSSVGSTVGGQLAGPLGGYLGSRLGRTLGNALDAKLFGSSSGPHGTRLAELGVQSSTYGKMIPIVYGNMRISGNIIWSRPIKETVTTSSSSAGGMGKGGGGKASQNSTNYSYSITMAIGVCEGPVDSVLRIWADAKQLDVSQYTIRTYTGTETQLPDTLIQSFEGTDSTTAHRGMCYVVFEDFPLSDFGNRIPNFTFEVRRKMLYPDYGGQWLENMLQSVVMIPGAGEFVYDTQVDYKIPGAQVGANWVQQGNQEAINVHTNAGKTNVMVLLDQLKDACPNVDYVSVVVSWFGDSLDAASCVILPGVEYQTGATTSPDSWQAGGFTRSTARLITQVGGGPQYGGTPDDDSIVRLLTELRARGYKIAFYPMLFMDVSGKPWRGELTGSSSAVSSFFTKTNGYNAFINYYAGLTAGKVDAFIIGSELKGLTKVTSSGGSYPAVTQLVSLAASVKATLGGSVKVTYAADWSEYHHTDGGWYNLDPLWASPKIDVIGIDAYFPLSDAQQAGYDVDALIAGWTSGEGYDWYYSDPARTTKATLTADMAWKNISWFWNNTHHNPGGAATAWVPSSKKIWFTEYGFPSVDGAANQPNVFYDPSSSASAFPYHSRGRIDFLAQRAALVATQQQWAGSSMVERMFVWTWDARPYPYWPDLTSVWSDGGAWKTGHWLQGKLGISSLAAILSELCLRAGLAAADIDATKVSQQLEGYIISGQQTIRSAIETLQQAFFFESVESDNVLKFVLRGADMCLSIAEDDLIPSQESENADIFDISRVQEIELPKRINVIYMNRLLNYQSSAQYS